MEIPQKAWNKRVISLTVSPQIATLNFKKQTNIYEPIIAIGYLWTKKTDSANQPTDSKALKINQATASNKKVEAQA